MKSSAPMKLAKKTGLLNASFMFCMTSMKTRSSLRPRPGITPQEKM
ncbi:hypothetical protein ACFQ0X_26920 [Streptomyces rectiviolaceus]